MAFGEDSNDEDHVVLLPLLEEQPFAGSFSIEFVFGAVGLSLVLFIVLPLVLALMVDEGKGRKRGWEGW